MIYIGKGYKIKYFIEDLQEIVEDYLKKKFKIDENDISMNSYGIDMGITLYISNYPDYYDKGGFPPMTDLIEDISYELESIGVDLDITPYILVDGTFVFEINNIYK